MPQSRKFEFQGLESLPIKPPLLGWGHYVSVSGTRFRDWEFVYGFRMLSGYMLGRIGHSATLNPKPHCWGTLPACKVNLKVIDRRLTSDYTLGFASAVFLSVCAFWCISLLSKLWSPFHPTNDTYRHGIPTDPDLWAQNRTLKTENVPM